MTLIGCAICVVIFGGIMPVSGIAMSIRIDINDEHQVIHSFGASDAWTCQFVGRYWPVGKRNAIADLLFSTDADPKGNPKGIGLSMWRFNVGAGSAEQGDAAGIGSVWHRAECFQNADGGYDWTKQQGQRWFAEAAKARGVRYLLAFTNSPPVHYTLNGVAHSDAGRSSLNIREGALPRFAGFLADVAAHFKGIGIPLDYISPINEPQHAWDSEKQEGSPASNSDIFEISRLIGQRLHDKALPTKVAIAETGSLHYLTYARGHNRASDQIKAFWQPSSPQYLGKAPNVAHVLSGHSYFTTWPIFEQIRVRENLRKRIEQIDPKLAFWQTEFCILEGNDETTGGWGRDLGVDTALYVARVIHSDLTTANASHWSWWLAISGSDYKDGLVYLDKLSGELPAHSDPLQRDGRVLASKILWALGNFSRFVRPGMVRVGVTYDDHRSLADAASSVMASAYIDKKTKRLVVVLINVTKDEQAVKLSGVAVRGSELDAYTTSETADLTRGSTTATDIHLPPRSVVTVVGAL